MSGRCFIGAAMPQASRVKVVAYNGEVVHREWVFEEAEAERLVAALNQGLRALATGRRYDAEFAGPVAASGHYPFRDHATMAEHATERRA